jgi:hypothetical protein
MVNSMSGKTEKHLQVVRQRRRVSNPVRRWKERRDHHYSNDGQLNSQSGASDIRNAAAMRKNTAKGSHTVEGGQKIYTLNIDNQGTFERTCNIWPLVSQPEQALEGQHERQGERIDTASHDDYTEIDDLLGVSLQVQNEWIHGIWWRRDDDNNLINVFREVRKRTLLTVSPKVSYE